MAFRSVGVAEAKAHFSELLDDAIAGDVITITRNREPVAVLSRPDYMPEDAPEPAERDDDQGGPGGIMRLAPREAASRFEKKGEQPKREIAAEPARKQATAKPKPKPAPKVAKRPERAPEAPKSRPLTMLDIIKAGGG